MTFNIVYTQKEFLKLYDLFMEKLTERRSDFQIYVYDRIVKELYPNDQKASSRLVSYINPQSYLKDFEIDLYNFVYYLKNDFYKYDNDISIEYNINNVINNVIEEKTKEYDHEFIWKILSSLATKFNFQREFSYEEIKSWLED